MLWYVIRINDVNISTYKHENLFSIVYMSFYNLSFQKLCSHQPKNRCISTMEKTHRQTTLQTNVFQPPAINNEEVSTMNFRRLYYKTYSHGVNENASPFVGESAIWSNVLYNSATKNDEASEVLISLFTEAQQLIPDHFFGIFITA